VLDRISLSAYPVRETIELLSSFELKTDTWGVLLKLAMHCKFD